MSALPPKLSTTISRYLESRRGDIVRATETLIRVASENPPGNQYRECAAAIRAVLDDVGLRPDVVAAGADDGAPCIMASIGSSSPTFYLHGHYDVVPAQDREQFELRLLNDRLFGRGSADMKGGLAAVLFAMLALRDSGVTLRGRVQLVIVPDEETAGGRGTSALVRRGLIDRNAVGMITAEPTSGVVWNASRGAISLRTAVRGRPVHVGLQFAGRNAFEGLLEIADELTAMKRKVERHVTAYAIRPAAARNSILMIGGELSGGTNFNVVPGRASFTIDRRLNPEEDFEVAQRALLDLFERARRRGIAVDVETIQTGRASSTSHSSALSTALGRSVRDVTKRAPRFEMCPGMLETRYYAALGIPALAYGPGLLRVAHGPKEFVAVRRLVECARVYALTAARMLR